MAETLSPMALNMMILMTLKFGQNPMVFSRGTTTIVTAKIKNGYYILVENPVVR